MQQSAHRKRTNSNQGVKPVDAELCRVIDANQPKLNPDICNGYAAHQMTEIETVKYIDRVFRSAAADFPEGLTYEGCRPCTPLEEFNEATKKKGNNKRTLDVAESHVFLMKYFFRYKGEEIIRFIYLPFVGPGGTIKMSGSHFHISPVLSDRVISIGMSSVFVRLQRDVITFERLMYNIVANNRREQLNVAHALIYHKDAKDKKARLPVKMTTTMAHYLFCRYGLMKAFEMFANCKPIIGGPELRDEDYPQDQWVVCASTQLKPKGCGKGLYEPSKIKLVVRREDWERGIVKNLIAGFFYVVDHFPTRIKPEYINETDKRYMDNRSTWISLMGTALFGDHIHEGVLRDKIESHLRSLDEYVDNIVLSKLQEINLPMTNIYQIMAYIVENISDMLFKAKGRVNSMYDKELSVIYFVMKDITSEIFKMYFKLKAASKKELTKNDINERMNKTISSGKIFSITRQHPEVTTVSSSGDNMALKMTISLIPQSGSSKQTRSRDQVVVDDPAIFLHASFVEIGGYSNQPKSDPIGHARINPWVKTNPNGLVLRDPRFFDLMEDFQAKVQRQ
jgi:hypothetical protein